MVLKQFTYILIILLLNIFRKTWRDIPKHYKGLAFISFLNVTYYYLCKRHLVWEFTHGGINWRVLRAIHVLITTPAITLLFLSNLPNSILKKVIYLIKYVSLFTGKEYIIHKQKLIQYKYGWNVYWSGLVYFKMFVYSYLITIKPLLTYFLSFISMIFFVWKFKVPLSKRLLKGSFFMLLPQRKRSKSKNKILINNFLKGISSYRTKHLILKKKM